MPPRARGRGSRGNGNLDPQINTARLPQELIDAIIDEFDESLKDESNPPTYPDRKALRACALVSRAFVRPSQMKLFSTVNLRAVTSYGAPPDETYTAFSKLLSSKPHIGSYVRNLVLSYRSGRSNSVEYILSSLPKLKMLSLHPTRDYAQWRETVPFPAHGKDAFLAVFSLASLQRLELRNHQFSDALELDAILSNSLGLKELLLAGIRFTGGSPRPSEKPARVVLRSLELLGMQDGQCEAMMSGFGAVDVTHLRSISLTGYSRSLLHANSLSLEELTLVGQYSPGRSFPSHLDQILPPNTRLRTLNLRIYNFDIISAIIRQLGNLANVKTLRRISITVPEPGVAWDTMPGIDSLLQGVGSELEDIDFRFDNGLNPHHARVDVARVRRCLPNLDAKGILRITYTSPGSELRYPM
ncbi:hypothetical protein DFH07DRAFT_801763 [Mycena maculata]|uniref:F-box domain-containing protein n=1 Tax=Mycena maculata TaxID=230809 RepID=A0AAD7NRR4_9AGAR|nr:hypothetical protein DFH07DRAFT_801763 [Mycena maculata]